MIREMEPVKLYVGGLPFRFTKHDLRGLCEKYGDIEDGMNNYLIDFSRRSLS